MTAADDNAILAVLNAVPNLTVYDGDVTDSDGNAKTISAPLPYVVFYSGAGDDEIGDSLAGSVGAHLNGFQITYVGATREQAQSVGDRARDALNRRFIAMPVGQRFVRRSDDSQPVRRDDVWTRPDGGPLFYGADRFTVGA